MSSSVVFRLSIAALLMLAIVVAVAIVVTFAPPIGAIDRWPSGEPQVPPLSSPAST
jgi:hypothetical protein